MYLTVTCIYKKAFISHFLDHFIVRKWLDGGYYLKYSFQVQKNKSKFLGLNGTQLDIVVRLLLCVLLKFDY